ncbi:hypothetical protein [Methanobrevibacter sp.]|uniref:hypothetical protein n=1 Tax=Methanobrevibacter sp. TaxID=66852 RepID=UPI003890C4ED
MKSKTYVFTILIMFFLTLSCAYAAENQTADNTLLSSPVDNVDLSSPVDSELLGSAPSSNGINYEDLVIKDINFTGDRANLHIEGFSQNGLEMSDFTMSIVPASDSSNLDLKMNIPAVNYMDFDKKTFFTFKNLDLSILPSSDPQSLEFSAIMDSLELITGMNYVNLNDLNLFFKSFPDKGVQLDIDMGKFMYNNFNDTSFDFDNLNFRMGLGLNGQALTTTVILPTLNLVTGANKINLNDLNLNIALPDLKLSNLDLSIVMPYFHFANEDTIIDMTDVDVSLEPILNSTSFNSIIRMGTLGITGVNSTGELFPLLNVSNMDFENFTTGLNLSSVDLSGIISTVDISKMDLSKLVHYLSSGFDIKTYTDNMPDQYKSSLDFNGVDLSSTGLSGFNLSDIGSIFTNMDFSSIGSSTLDLSGLFKSAGINISDFGIDMSKYNISSISISEISDIIGDPNFNKSAIFSKLNLTNLDLGGFDIGEMIKNFNLSSMDFSDILKVFNITGFNLTEFMKGFDLDKLLKLFMKQNAPDNGTTPDYPAPNYRPVKNTYYNAASKTYTVTRLSDNQLICKANLFILEYLNKLFNMTFINGHLKVYIDGKLVFEGDTTDDLTQVIFEIIDEYLGEHEITVEFTNSEGKSNKYSEKIIVE